MSELIVENRYEIIIFWSDEDRAFLADVPELPGCMAHGTSHEEALRNAQEAIQLWVETAEEDGRAIPQPKGRRLVYA
jgi:predicted RNase H-like HicB family nuclease